MPRGRSLPVEDGQPAVDVSHVHSKQGPIASRARHAWHAATTVALDLLENAASAVW